MHVTHCYVSCVCLFFFFKQKTAYEMRISDWSSDVCSSDLFIGRSTAAVTGMALASSSVFGAPAFIQNLGKPNSKFNGVQIGAKIGRASCRERVCQYV